MSSASASPASYPMPKTPSPAPESSQGSSPKSSPNKSPKKKTSVDREEVKKKKAEEKVDKWRKAQVVKIQKVIEKQESKAKDLCDKLSAAWDPYGISNHQIRLLESGVISTPEDLIQKKEAYEMGPDMMEDFLKWIRAHFGVDEPVAEATAGAGSNDASDEMDVDPQGEGANGATSNAAEREDEGEDEADDEDDE